MEQYGPQEKICARTHAEKYRAPGETFMDFVYRFSGATSDDENHRLAMKSIIANQRYLPAGRSQRAVGGVHAVTAVNCFVSGTIEDSTDGIFDRLKEAFKTMRMGGGIGYDFSTIRYRGAMIKSQGQPASGAVSFMGPYDAMCKTVASAGNRRGAMMAVLRSDHPDIEEFVRIKSDLSKLTGFNISVGVLDSLMAAVKKGGATDLLFEGKSVSTVDARALWDLIMRTTWDYAEPGVLFLDTINRMNNLYYCEHIAATNPCGEQPLPPYGACLLGSHNAVKYVKRSGGKTNIDYEQLMADIPNVIRATDNIIDLTQYPLEQQQLEQQNKRRMGIGFAGLANAIEACGHPYASEAYIRTQNKMMKTLMNEAYRASALLAKEKGSFPLFDKEKYLDGNFVKQLDPKVRDLISQYGIRNSHLTSMAPTGTIAFSADNISGGIEPVFALEQDRIMNMPEGPIKVRVKDYGWREFGVKAKCADELTPMEHVSVLVAAQKYVDSAVSKTCNIGDDATFEEFKKVYMAAYDGGAKGCTTFRAAGKRFGILTKVEQPADEPQGESCTFDPQTGARSCSD